MRDFLYNKGDVLIAVLIIVVAVVVIYFRVGVVMGNTDPGGELQQLITSTPQTGQTDNNASTGTVNGDASQGQAGANTPAVTAPAVTGTTEDQTTQTPAVTGTSDAQATTPDQSTQEVIPPAQTPAAPAKPAPGTVDTQITVSAGDAASTIADKLYAAGAISDQQAFLSEVIAQKADSKLKQGTFTIPAGSSMADIVKILVG